MIHDIAQLIVQCSHNDVDSRIDAVTKLQHSLETRTEIVDKEASIAALKSCLRTPNQHLITATLSALPPFFPLLVPGIGNNVISSADVLTLKQCLGAFLSAGGIIDRLGDSRERTRDKARHSLVILGTLSFYSSPPQLHLQSKSRDIGKGGHDTPLMMWERYFKDSGLQSKVWRVREQSIITLVELRRAHETFPLRPYLPHLVDALEDTDGTVRECARQSVVDLFSGPGVTDGARADLKKEMTRKGVRRSIVDSILLKLLAGSASAPASEFGSENGDISKRENTVQSMNRATTAGKGINRDASQGTVVDAMSRPASRIATPIIPGETSDAPAVYIASSKDLENEFAHILPHFQGKETEHNWAARENSIIRIRGMLKGDVHERYFDTFMTALKEGVLDATFKTLASLRTTVCTNTCFLYVDLVSKLGPRFDPFCEPLLTQLLRMAGFTKKLAATQSQAAVTAVLINTSAHARFIPQTLWHTFQDKNVQARSFSIGHVQTYIATHGLKAKPSIEAVGGVDFLEKCIKKALGDANPGVRERARLTFWMFHGIWNDRGTAMISSLDAVAKKQLEKVCPNPQALGTLPSTPVTKKSSVAAAIAASRAKAKAIAFNPPTLRHQATSTSHAANMITTSPPSPRQPLRFSRPISPITSSRSASMSNVRNSPPVSPMRRIVSMCPPAVATTSEISTTHNRSRSTDGPLPQSPVRETVHRRRSSVNVSSGPCEQVEPQLHTPLPNSPTRQYQPQTSPLAHRRNGSNITSLLPLPVGQRPHLRIGSLVPLDHNIDGDQSLLLATNIPIPEDIDSDEDDSNMLSSSAPYEAYPPPSKITLSNPSTSSPPTSVSPLIVEDALRARAEQAQNTAERLLELVEPDDPLHVSPIPSTLLVSNGTSSYTSQIHGYTSSARLVRVAPNTPMTNGSTIIQQASQFRDSPVKSRGTSLIDVLKERKNETGWWLKRMLFMSKATLAHQKQSYHQPEDLESCITAMEENLADSNLLRSLAITCMEKSLNNEFWNTDKRFERMLNTLLRFLQPVQSETNLECGFFALWAILENQGTLVDGFEGDIYPVLLRVRYCNKANVLEATNTIRDCLTVRTEPVYGLTTLHSSLRIFFAEAPPSNALVETKSASYAFGLIALGKLILKLPSEILEEELPRLRSTLTSALNNHGSLVVRESAAAAIIASQIVLGDETHLFTLLDGLADEKKNLLTYLFDKHGVRGQTNRAKPLGVEKLVKEMSRLDNRMNTTPRTEAS